MKIKMAMAAVALLGLSACNSAHTQHQPINWQAFGGGLQQMGMSMYNNSEAYRRAKVHAKGMAYSGNRTIQNNFSSGMYGGYNPNMYSWGGRKW